MAEVVTLCGSTKFKDAIHAENMRLTMEGNLVISLGVFGHTDLPDYDWTTDASDLKRMLDALHRQKIDLADRVHVVNVGGYYGESTAREIEYARSLGKPVTFMVALGVPEEAEPEVVPPVTEEPDLPNGHAPVEQLPGFLARRVVPPVPEETVREWADYFEHHSSHVGGRPVFTGDEIAAILRGPKPFGSSRPVPEGDKR